MLSFRHLSLRRKQTWIMMLTSTIVLLLAGAALTAYDVLRFRREMVASVSSLAQLLSLNTVAALEFNDPAAGAENLAALRGVPNIVRANIYGRSGQRFAEFVATRSTLPFDPPTAFKSGHAFTANQLRLMRPITQGAEVIGWIEVEASLEELRGRLWRYAGIAGLVLLVSLLAAFELSRRLQKLVSDPILQLAQLSRSVADNKNYALRATKHSEDELGQLVDGFNLMLTQIQERDAALQGAREQLEQRVAARTGELARSVALLNAALEASVDGVLAVDLAGNVTSYNQRFVELWQYPEAVMARRDRDELTMLAARQLKDATIFHDRVAQLRVTPEREQVDILEFHDGRSVERISRRQHIDNVCVGSVITFRDITERKRATEALHQSENRFRMLVEESPDVIGIYQAGKLVFINAIGIRLFGGQAKEELLGRTSDQMIHPDDRAQARDRIRRRLAGEKGMYPAEVRYMRLGGATLQMEVSAAPITLEGKPAVQFIARDITERKLAQKQLAENEARLRLILESVPECVKLVAVDGTVLDMNPAGLAMVEVERLDEVVGRMVHELVPPEYQPALRALNTAVFRGESKTEEYELIGRKGTHRWMETCAGPLRDNDGRIIAQLAVTRDITQRKQAATELENIHRQLLETSHLAGMAEVATNVLHNVGNVLNSVNISAALVTESVKRSKISSLTKIADLLRDHAADLGRFFTADPRGRQLPAYLAQLSELLLADQQAAVAELDSLRGNIEHIKEIVAMQQSYAKVGGVKEVLSVQSLLEDSLRMNEGALTRHRVAVIREFSPVPPLVIEKHKLLQILVNLVRNAKQACQEVVRNDKRLTLRLARGAGGIVISVADNGVGIPAENLTRIFNYGFTTRKDGHGFGLHSGSLAAKEMGGTLSVQSDGVGQGATFTLVLPESPNENEPA